MKNNFTKAGYGFDNTDLFEEELSQTLLFQSSVQNQTCHLVFLLQNFPTEPFGRYSMKYYIILAKRLLELVTVSLHSNLNACQC